MSNLLHSRVALKDGADNVYVFALAGTEGWVRATKEDPDGFQLYKIEWDKEHWRYNGQPDGWTFAEHFKIIAPPDPDAEQIEPEEVEEETPEMDLPLTKDDLESYMEALSEAFDAAAEAEGFFLITVRRMPNPENPSEMAFIPSAFQHASTKEAQMLLDIQLAECASSNYQEMMFNLMTAMEENPADGNDE